MSQSSPIKNISTNIISNNNYDPSNNTIYNKIEEKRKRKELEKQKEREYDLNMERKYQEYLKKQKELENNNNNSNKNFMDQNTLKRPISNREKTINDIFNDNNINEKIIKSIQNNQKALINDNIKNRTNYNNFNVDNMNQENKTRNKNATSTSSFIVSGKGIMDSFNQQIKTVDDIKMNNKNDNNILNINYENKLNIVSNNINETKNNNQLEFSLNKNTSNQNIIDNNDIINNNNMNNNIKNDEFGFTFKNMAETEQMIDKIFKETDEYLKGTLQQSFINKEEKENILYKKLNNGQNPEKKIEFQGTFGMNKIFPEQQKTSHFGGTSKNHITKNIENKENKNNINNEIKIDKAKNNIESNLLNKNLLNKDENNIKKDEIKNEKKNNIVNVDELLKGINLQALNYHSKYEEIEEDKNVKSTKNENREQNQKLEESLKSVSKLVSSKSNNETWKKDSIKKIAKKDKQQNEDLEKNENKEYNYNEENINIDKKDENQTSDNIEKNKKIMDFLNNRKKDKKIKYKLAPSAPPKNDEELILNLETEQQAVNSSIKLNGSLDPNLKITFGNKMNMLSNQSIKFKNGKETTDKFSKFTFGKNIDNSPKNNTSTQNINESFKDQDEKNESLEEDEEKNDIKLDEKNEDKYDNMLNKNDDLKFLDFDNFLDISKIKKNNLDKDDLCNIRYTPEEEQKQNERIKEALNDAIDSSDEENLNNKNEPNLNIQNMAKFSGENTLGLKNNNNDDMKKEGNKNGDNYNPLESINNEESEENINLNNKESNVETLENIRDLSDNNSKENFKENNKKSEQNSINDDIEEMEDRNDTENK